MAAVNISTVLKLTNKAGTLAVSGQFASATAKYGEALAAAEALQQEDCVVASWLRCVYSDHLLDYKYVQGLSPERLEEVLQLIFQHLVPTALVALNRRRKAGTLLRGACRAYEQAYFYEMSKLRAGTGDSRNRRSTRVTRDVGERCGFDTYVFAARFAVIRVGNVYGEVVPLRDALLSSHCRFIADAIDLVANHGAEEVITTTFVQCVESHIQDNVFNPAVSHWHVLFWRRGRACSPCWTVICLQRALRKTARATGGG